jgi:predicted acetyltransferase
MQTWLLRVVDVAKALEKRGYPSGVQAELHLEVQDDLIAENNGRFILSVSHGQGEVTRGGTGELKLHIRELAPLYTSLFTPYQLQLTGRLEAIRNSSRYGYATLCRGISLDARFLLKVLVRGRGAIAPKHSSA